MSFTITQIIFPLISPVDENGKIIYKKNTDSANLTSSTKAGDASDDTGVNVGSPCPPFCPT